MTRGATAPPPADGSRGRWARSNRIATTHIRCCLSRPGAPPAALLAPADDSEDLPRISGFELGLPLRRGRRCGLQGAPPSEYVPCLAWHLASAAARGRIPDQGSSALASDIRNSAWVSRRGGAATAGCGAHRSPHSCHRGLSALHAPLCAALTPLCAAPSSPRGR